MREVRSGFFFLGFASLVLWQSLRLGLGTLREPGSGFLSFCAAMPLALFSMVLIHRGWGIRESLKGPSHRVILALVSLFVYSLTLNALGFIVATFLLVGILFHLGESRRWWALLWMSALVTFLAYLVFGVLLSVYFTRGLLGI